MLRTVADGVLVHESQFMQSNAVVVDGRDGVLLVDPGVLGDELMAIARDLRELARPIVRGFSTHPHWDHLLWHDALGPAPRYGTARCAATAQARLSDPGAKARVANMIPADIVERVPLDRLGVITGLPADAGEVPWEGPRVRILEHQAHAPGHAALFVEERRVLIAGDMLSNVLVPILDLNGTADPIADYLAGLQLIEGIADEVDVVIPGHGSVGTNRDLRARIDLDRAYVLALRDGTAVSDSRIGPAAQPGWEWVADLHEGQLRRLAGAA